MNTTTKSAVLSRGLKKMVLETCQVKNLKPEDLSDADPVIGGQGALKLDSLDAVEIVSLLDREFGLQLDNAGDARKVLRSFQVMTEYVREHAEPQRIDRFCKTV